MAIPSDRSPRRGARVSWLFAALCPILLVLLLFMSLQATTAATDRSRKQLPSRPEEAAALEFANSIGGSVGAVVVSDTIAFVGEGAALLVLDVSQPDRPARLARLPLPDIVHAVEISGPLAYLAVEHAGLYVIDINDPAQPSIRGAYDTPGLANGLVVREGLAYISDGAAGLQIVDVTNPDNLLPVGQYDVPDFSWQVQLAGAYALLIDANQGLYVLDVSQPAEPALAAYYYELRATDLDVENDRAYLVGNEQLLSIYDVSQPISPTFLGRWEAAPSAREVTVAGDVAYVTTYGTVQMIDVGNPQEPFKIGTALTETGIVDVTVSGGYLYAADGTEGLWIVEPLSQSQTPGLWSSSLQPHSVEVEGDIAVTTGEDLHVLDVSEPSSPTVAAVVPIPYARDVVLRDSLAYVAAGTDGLTIFDLSMPATPTLLSEWEGIAAALLVQDGLAYVSGGGQLTLLDVSQPQSPTLRSTFATGESLLEIAAGGNYIYGADRDGFQVIDVSDPGEPFPAGRYTIPEQIVGEISGFALFEDVVYLTIHDAATIQWLMLAVDVRDPAHPVLLRTYPGYAGTLTVQGNYLFASGRPYSEEQEPPFNTLYVLEGNAAGLLPRAQREMPDYIQDVALAGDLLLVADGNGGLQILRLHPERFSTTFLPLIR